MSHPNKTSLILASIFSLLTAVMGNTVLFWNPDPKNRTIYFSPNLGSAEIPNQHVASSMVSTTVVTFPQGWGGSFKSVFPQEDQSAPKIIVEIQFQGWQGLTYYDISAVNNCCDNSGVRYISPSNGGPTSGCFTAPFPCGDSYSKPGNIQVKSSAKVDFVCALGDITSVGKPIM
ncbi:hypothetical protein OCU04_000544 [Sclerotinia nivalis]|uniref:Uncharacterized protein n=1 Tax=Sclerotinia nivalis TaxID=352851 RepID=A0A9X0AWA1_9HELO|nr:hypothetical protein OCU04_000544 [Sclerotinia nivalis]